MDTIVVLNRKIKTLTDNDFNTSDSGSIICKLDGCWLIAFHTNNTESKNLLYIFSLTCSQVPSPGFAICDLINNPIIAQSFTKIKSDARHPYHEFGPNGYPFILNYTNGVPIAFYNGNLTVENLSEYATTLACSVLYSEKKQNTIGYQAEQRYAMSGTAKSEMPKSSEEFIETKYFRGYDPTVSPVIQGSAEEKKAVEKEEQKGASFESPSFSTQGSSGQGSSTQGSSGQGSSTQGSSGQGSSPQESQPKNQRTGGPINL